MVLYWATRLDTVPAARDTVRSREIACVTSVEPKHSISSAGMIRANSTAARPRRSPARAEQARRTRRLAVRMIMSERLVAEHGRAHQQPVVAGHVRHVEPQGT